MAESLSEKVLAGVAGIDGAKALYRRLILQIDEPADSRCVLIPNHKRAFETCGSSWSTRRVDSPDVARNRRAQILCRPPQNGIRVEYMLNLLPRTL